MSSGNTSVFLRRLEQRLRPTLKQIAAWLGKTDSKGVSPSLSKGVSPSLSKGVSPSLIEPPISDEIAVLPAPATAFYSEGFGWIRFGDTLLAVPANAAAARDVLDVLTSFAKMQNVSLSEYAVVAPSIVSLVPANGPYTVGRALRSPTPKLRDAWLADTHGLRMVFERTPAGARATGLRLFQMIVTSDGQARMQEVGASGLSAESAAMVAASLANPLLPAMAVVVSGEGLVLEAGILAFPALCRGGLHHGELRALAPTGHPTEALLAYDKARFDDLTNGAPAARSIVADNNGGTGNEPLHSSDVAEWLGQIFRLTVGNADATEAYGQALVLPSDCLPTIAFLVSPEFSAAGEQRDLPAAHIVCDEISYLPRHTVVLPTSGFDLNALQPDSKPAFPTLRGISASARGAVPLFALRFRGRPRLHSAALLMPHAPDRPGPIIPSAASDRTAPIYCHISLGDETGDNRMLGALAEQTAAHRLRLLVAADAAGASLDVKRLLEHFPGGWVEVPADWDPFRARGRRGEDPLAAAPDDAVLLHLEPGVILHDNRTIAVLDALAISEGVAMAGCVSLSEMPARRGTVVSVENGGYFPSHVSVVGGPSLVFSSMDTLDALPDATYPVIAPPDQAFVIRLGDLRAAHAADPLLPGGPQPALQTGIVLTGMGRQCLCTSAIRTLTYAPPSYREAMDAVTLSRLPLASWQEVLSRVTLVQRVS